MRGTNRLVPLDRLERDFQALVIERAPGFAAEIVGTGRVPRDVRLAIYFDAYRSRLAEVLENNFPMMARLLGKDQFGELARCYVEGHPSRRFSVRWYGDELDDFLAGFDPYARQPALAELARWEWSMAHAFDAAAGSPVGASDLSAYPPEKWGALCFTLVPSVQLLSLKTNAPLIWRALSYEQTPPEPAAAPRDWLIWRRDLETRFRSLEEREARALQAAQAGEPFASICEAVAGVVGAENAGTEAAHLLAQWLADELIDEIRQLPAELAPG